MVVIMLTEEDKKRIKYNFNNGKVFTNGCFCGHAITDIKHDLYVTLDFSCRKSMRCNNPHYQVNSVHILEKANKHFTDNQLKRILDFYEEGYYDFYDFKPDFTKIYLHNDYFNDSTIDDLYYVKDNYRLAPCSLKTLQKKLFKYYKKTFGRCADLKFRDVGIFEYK